MEAQYSSAAVVFDGRSDGVSPEKAVFSSVTSCVLLLCSCSGRARTVAKSVYWLLHLRPSACNSAAPSGRSFVKFKFRDFPENLSRTPNLVEIDQNVWHFT